MLISVQIDLCQKQVVPLFNFHCFQKTFKHTSSFSALGEYCLLPCYKVEAMTYLILMS